jgi:hypothetical protein
MPPGPLRRAERARGVFENPAHSNQANIRPFYILWIWTACGGLVGHGPPEQAHGRAEGAGNGTAGPDVPGGTTIIIGSADGEEASGTTGLRRRRR